jgi:hypothetical protein
MPHSAAQQTPRQRVRTRNFRGATLSRNNNAWGTVFLCDGEKRANGIILVQKQETAALEQVLLALFGTHEYASDETFQVDHHAAAQLRRST